MNIRSPFRARSPSPGDQEPLHATGRCYVSAVESAIIRRLAGYVRMLLADMVKKPETCISGLPRSTRIGREQISGRSETEGLLLQDKCIHELFEKQAESTP